MAFEWEVVELLGPNRDGEKVKINVADGTSVSIGTLLNLTDPRSSTGKAVSGAATSGVASEDKEANVGVTEVSAWTQGRFEARCSGAMSVIGGPFIAGGDNHIGNWTSASLLAPSGTIQEVGSDAEIIEVRLNL